MSSPQKTALVISAHSADFVWRAGGAIAAHVKQGWKVRIICLSYGERGESAKLWRVPNMTMDRVKDTRQREAQAAADILGAEIEFWDLEDYPLRISDDTLFRLVDTYRTLQPEFVLSHSEHDPYNFDHPLAMRAAQEARILRKQKAIIQGRKFLAHRRYTLLSPIKPSNANGSQIPFWTLPMYGN